MAPPQGKSLLSRLLEEKDITSWLGMEGVQVGRAAFREDLEAGENMECIDKSNLKWTKWGFLSISGNDVENGLQNSRTEDRVLDRRLVQWSCCHKGDRGSGDWEEMGVLKNWIEIIEDTAILFYFLEEGSLHGNVWSLFLFCSVFWRINWRKNREVSPGWLSGIWKEVVFLPSFLLEWK